MRKRARFLVKSSSEESFCFPKWKRERQRQRQREFVREKGPLCMDGGEKRRESVWPDAAAPV